VATRAGTLYKLDPATAAWSYKPSTSSVSAVPALLGSFLYVGADDGKAWQVRAPDGVGLAWATNSTSGSAPSDAPLVFTEAASSRLLGSSGGSLKKLCIPWADTPGDKALLSLPCSPFGDIVPWQPPSESWSVCAWVQRPITRHAAIQHALGGMNDEDLGTRGL